MQGESNRDQAIERVLRRSRTSMVAPDEGACVDGERLAAWADGGLRPAEAASVEQHLSDCERCTALLATFVRMSPAPPVAESLWHSWHLRWLVPVATAATVAALWVAIPRNETVPTAIPDNAAPAQTQPSAIVDARKEPPATLSAPSASGALAKREEAPRPQSQIARADESRQERARERGETIVVPAQPATTLEADQKAAEAGATGRLAAPAAAEVPSESNTRAFAVRQVLAPVQVISPDPMTRWRVVGAGQVERSTTGGTQWEPASLPEATTLTAGSSPAPSVCWLVGRAGAVYLTTDGLRFTRVPFPERTDFVSIQASGDRRATVITIDGRTFRTEDQGVTWARVMP